MLCQMMYSIYDSKAETYGVPFFAVNDQVAKRQFQDAVNDSAIPFFHHPEDYSLVRVGEWRTMEGKVSGLDSPFHVCKGSDVKRPEVN